MNKTFFSNYHIVFLPASTTTAINRHVLMNSTLLYEEESSNLLHTHPFAATVICLLVVCMIISTLIGNTMVCLAVVLVRKLKAQPANLLLVSLAVADFSVGLFVMPVALVVILENKWILGKTICLLWTSADLMLCSASILNLCMICIDRYFAVIKALTYSAKRTRSRILCYIVVVWVFALLVSTTPLIVLPTNHVDDQCQVSQHQLYQIYATVISFYAPCLIMVILYWRMWQAAKLLQKKDQLTNKWSVTSKAPQDNGHPQHSALKNGFSPKKHHRPSALLHAVRVPLMHSNSGNHHERTEDKARKTLGVIMSVFIVCWVPFFILALLKSQYVMNVPKWLDLLVLWLGYSNSMLNPLIYCKYNREFRVPFREMLCCRFSTIQTVMRNESFHSKFGPPNLSELRSSTVTCAVPAMSLTPGFNTHNFELINNNNTTFSLNSDNNGLDYSKRIAHI
ncbi:unnamed protein product [Bursaphelenchus okinawaensis]|uniref:G-protein coupled receptors family 1 profile domain-containing protein n=1 Tax=Bursaphelenchus okinawaensis TaxID=465554 RepID=A0A811KJ33_9BILA|nr:unnamed protein product [Bursaphelenchus okinawaensis]CAG9104756.1 unnamed protein product [Bursaphelenchus okinawaensis]